MPYLLSFQLQNRQKATLPYKRKVCVFIDCKFHYYNF